TTRTRRSALYAVLCNRRSEVPLRVERRFVTGKNRIETVSKGEAIETRRRGNGGRGELTPDAGHPIASLQCKARHAKKGFAEEHAPNPAGDLIVPRRRCGFAGNLPQGAAGKRVGCRCPEPKAGGTSGGVIDRPLIRMEKLIDLEVVVVRYPATSEVPSDRRECNIKGFPIGVTQIEPIESEIESDNFQRRYQVTFTRLRSFWRRG